MKNIHILYQVCVNIALMATLKFRTHFLSSSGQNFKTKIKNKNIPNILTWTAWKYLSSSASTQMGLAPQGDLQPFRKCGLADRLSQTEFIHLSSFAL
jgi:hypothetical protein